MRTLLVLLLLSLFAPGQSVYFWQGFYRAKYRRSGQSTGRYLAYKKNDCGVNGRKKVYLKNRGFNDPSFDTLWKINGDESVGVKIEAALRQCREKMLYFKRKKCKSSFVGLSSRSQRWKIRLGEPGLSNDYRYATITSNTSPLMCRGRALGSDSKKKRAKLVKNRGKDKWELEFCGYTIEDCSSTDASPTPPPPSQRPSPPPPVRFPPPPPRVPSESPPPDVQSRTCETTTSYYNHQTHATSDAVRQVCSALWDVDRNQYPLPNAGIGREITCRRDSYELPTGMDWSINKPTVCDMITDLAASELGVDRADLVDPCGMWFWCIDPSVSRLQWSFRMKTTYG